MKGKVYLIGAGPGAPDLITVRGAGILQRADIVFYDALVHPGTVALAAKARKVAVGKRCSRVSTDQRFIKLNIDKGPIGSSPWHYSLKAPTNAAAVPGYYFLFALNKAGVPSIAKSVLVGPS